MHISVSQLNLLRKCGIAYERRYINGEKIPPGFAAHVGTGVHVGANWNFQQKIETRTDLPVTDITEASVEAMRNSVEEQGVMLESGKNESLELGRAVDLTASLASYHAVNVSPKYQPIFTEQKFTIPLPTGKDLLGIIDLVAEHGEHGKALVDLKTTKRSKNQREADTSLQLTAYSLGVKRLTGEFPELIQLGVLVHSEKGIKQQNFETTRGAQDFKILAAHLNAAEKVIQAGAFTPAADGSWWCLSLDTELLTRRGWMDFSKMKEDDDVLTLNPYSFLLEWQRPSLVFKKPWGKRMVSYVGRGIRYCVTPDHRMLVRSLGRGKYRTVLANEIEGKGSIVFPVAAYLNRPGTDKPDDILSLSGWMCAEGHFRTDSAMIEISQKRDTQHWNEIVSIVNRLKLPYSEWDDPDGSCSAIRIKAVGGRYIRDVVQNSKSIPSWLWDADGRQFRIWLSALVKGDGHRSTQDNFTINQKDEAFIDELQALCVTHRMSAAKGGELFSTTGGRHNCLSVLDGITERIPEPASAKKHFVENKVDDEVWCVTVPNSYIMTRYQGRTLIVGNCSKKWCGYASTCPFYKGEHDGSV